ncbi:restriction endonuclease subunit S [Corynebacterium sp. YIM 101645]|uniref:Restriction endonuclease subunit S n=1 Tax=Corynebacterium lemuris TaxID=1859292 RepID=A0ABT2FVC8_9CORY|nr:restriction endonuclease subunit S [Corynebacterium lemuris]MCS5478730.1 restriction endonuclease subunit S [Corynebacterium lemuris]
MAEIDVSGWGEFLVVSLFDSIVRGNRLKISDRIPGETPLVTAGFENYGIADYVDASRVVNQEHSGVTVTVDMFGNVFVRTEPFICDDNILVFKNEQSLRANAFIAATLRATIRTRFNYTDQFRMKSLNGLTVKLPVTPDGEPDWGFMESRIERVQYGVQKRADDLESQIVSSTPMDVSEWGEFVVGELFEIRRGVRQKSQDRSPGGVPYYSASDTNNGVVDHVSNPAFLAENCIVYTIFGDVFYAPGEFTAGDDVSLLHHEKLNEKNGLFVAAALRRNKSKYSFNEKAFSGKISKDVIKLPVADHGEPDWDYMEAYISNVAKKVKQRADVFN